MMRFRMMATAFAAALLTACGPVPMRIPPQPTPRPAPEAMPSMAAGTVCDPEADEARSRLDREYIARMVAEEPRLDEIRVVVRAPAALARERVTAAMLACKMPLSQSGDGVIAADYGQQTGLIGQYAITAHAAVVALTDSTTLVRLSGQETSKRGKVLNPSVNTFAITNKNMGRSLSVWMTLRNVAKQLRADPALRANLEASTALALLYTR